MIACQTAWIRAYSHDFSHDYMSAYKIAQPQMAATHMHAYMHDSDNTNVFKRLVVSSTIIHNQLIHIHMVTCLDISHDHMSAFFS